MTLGNMRELGCITSLGVPANLTEPWRLGSCSSQRPLLVSDELLQITAEYELGMVRQVAQCGHEVDHAVPIPSDVIELLNLVHATAPHSPLLNVLMSPLIRMPFNDAVATH